MPKVSQRLADGMAETIRNSVTETFEMYFNTAIDIGENSTKEPSAEEFICCGEFLQKDALAHILFLFDYKLIEKLVRQVFPADALDDPSAYESTASEIVNIVGNCLKKYLNSNGYHFEMAIPFIPDRDRFSPAGDLVVQMAFSFKSDSAMGIDFYIHNP